MLLTTPLIIEGDEYPFALVSLSINATPTAEGGTSLSYSRRVIPARVVEGVLQKREDHATNVLFHGDPAGDSNAEAAENYLKTLI